MSRRSIIASCPTTRLCSSSVKRCANSRPVEAPVVVTVCSTPFSSLWFVVGPAMWYAAAPAEDPHSEPGGAQRLTRSPSSS